MYLLVAGKSLQYLPDSVKKYNNDNCVVFSDYSPKPKYEDIKKGVEVFRENNCDSIVAIGGGSAIDTAKLIKLFATMDPNIDYLKQEHIDNHIKLTAIPTTAGSGAEVTRYAIFYVNGNKQTITESYLVPDEVILEPSVLKSLPDNQKKSTLLDALGHCMESFWSTSSTDESKDYARKGMKIILDNYQAYLNNDESTFALMQEGALLAGKAINITKTTAGHGMCYKITTKFNIPHGHCVALVIDKLYPYFLNNIDRCQDSRGTDYLKSMFDELQTIITPDKFSNILSEMNFDKLDTSNIDYDLFVNSVDPERMSTNPIKLTRVDISNLYHQILAQ